MLSTNYEEYRDDRVRRVRWEVVAHLNFQRPLKKFVKKIEGLPTKKCAVERI